MKKIIPAALLLAGCTFPLADPRVSDHWAMDVCAELDRSEQRACMREGLKEAPADPPQGDVDGRAGR